MTNSMSLDAYRQIVGALDQMDRSAGVVSSLVDARTRYQVAEPLAEIHRRLEQVRSAVEDVLYDDHGRLGFESEAPTSPVHQQASRNGKLTPEALEAIRLSGEPLRVIAKRYGVCTSRVSEIRRGGRARRARWGLQG